MPSGIAFLAAASRPGSVLYGWVHRDRMKEVKVIAKKFKNWFLITLREPAKGTCDEIAVDKSCLLCLECCVE